MIILNKFKEENKKNKDDEISKSTEYNVKYEQPRIEQYETYNKFLIQRQELYNLWKNTESDKDLYELIKIQRPKFIDIPHIYTYNYIRSKRKINDDINKELELNNNIKLDIDIDINDDAFDNKANIEDDLDLEIDELELDDELDDEIEDKIIVKPLNINDNIPAINTVLETDITKKLIDIPDVPKEVKEVKEVKEKKPKVVKEPKEVKEKKPKVVKEPKEVKEKKPKVVKEPKEAK
jgi:hypothetical protein